MANRVRIEYVRSAIGYNVKQRRTIAALGLHNLGDTVEQDDCPVIRGMIHKISHLVRVQEVQS